MLASRLAIPTFALLASLLFAVTAFAQPTQIRLASTAATSTEKVAFALAKNAGILKKHNIDLEVILITGGPVAMQALLARSIDLVTTSATVFLHGFVEGADVKIVGGVNNRFPYTFFTRPNITSPVQLKGKTLGITRYGSTDELATRMALEQFGLSAKTDVKFIQGGGSAGRITALQAGSIDGTSLISGVSHVARKAGMNPMLDFAEKEIDYQMTGVVGRGDYLKSNAEALRRFLRAYVESIRYYKTHKDEALKKAMQLQKLGDREALEIGYHSNLKSLPDDGRPTVKGTQLVIEAAILDDPRAKNYTPQQLMDLSFLP